jgi:hypothetical protein
MKPAIRNLRLLLLLAAGPLCCGRDSDDRIYITAIKVVNTTDRQIFNPSEELEIEVHIFESNTKRFIACSGEDNGLRKVDYSGVHYAIEAKFRKPNGKDLKIEEVETLNIYLEVYEDDFYACPQEPISDDDLVGTSSPFSGNELRAGKIMSFGNVAHLQIGRGREESQAVNAPAL